MKQRITLLTLLLIALTGLTSAQIVFDDSNNVEFNTGLDLSGQQIVNYYSACPNGEFATDIDDNGDLICESVSATGSQDLSQVLENGNIANQTIEFEGFNTSVGNKASANLDGGTAYGYNASADTLNGVAIGAESKANLGMEGSMALGANSVAEGSGIALGYISSATGKRAVAIGNRAVADNDNEVSLGAFDGEQLNLNVTGNATINENLEVKGELKGVDTGSSASGLSEVLEQNSKANQTIGFEDSLGIQIGNSSTNTYAPGEIAIGPGAEALTASSIANDIAIGGNADASDIYNDQIALGSDSLVEGEGSLAFGFDSSATGDSSVAIGYRSNAPNNYEATFGNLNGQELDLNVTGNATVHGSGGLSLVDESAVISLGDNYKIYGANAGAGAITIGDSTTSSGGTGSLTIGKGAGTAAGGVALGNDANGGQAGAALGSSAKSGYFGAALGNDADASGTTAGIAIGGGADANADGAVAIGRKSKAPNKYETTLGALSGTDIAGNSVRMDLNVTGNATIHGSGGLDMPNGVVIGNQADVAYSGDIAVGKGASASSTLLGGVYPNNTGIGEGVSADGISGSAAYGAGASADGEDGTALGSQSIADDQWSTALGHQAEAPRNSVSIGAFVGDQSGQGSVSIGRDAQAPGSQAVAIGRSAYSPNNNEATFGNLQGEELDLNVTGNATIHGRIEETNVRDISYSSGHTAWSSGLSSEEVNRFGTNSTESVEVDRLDVQLKGGGSNSNFEVEAYDAGTGSVLGSTTAGTPINDVGTTSEGGDLTIRVTNSDGSDVTASITVTGHVVE